MDAIAALVAIALLFAASALLVGRRSSNYRPVPPEPTVRSARYSKGLTDMNDLKLLGLKVRDRVTGFTGVCESISYDLYGCIQAAVRPAANSEKGEIPDGRWFDVSRLDVLNEKAVMDIPGGRFSVQRTSEKTRPSQAHGPADKPYR